MPRETVHRGKKLVRVKHPVTENVGAWDEDLEFKYPVLNPGDTDWTDPNPKDGIVVQTPSFEVSWSKPGEWDPEDVEGFVQFSISVDRDDILRVAKELEEHEDISAHGFYTTGIPRATLNETIRVIKRARNAAFGSDE